MKEYFVRTCNEKYSDIVIAENGRQAIEIFKQKYHLSKYKNFVIFLATDIFN